MSFALLLQQNYRLGHMFSFCKKSPRDLNQDGSKADSSIVVTIACAKRGPFRLELGYHGTLVKMRLPFIWTNNSKGTAAKVNHAMTRKQSMNDNRLT